MHIKVLHLRTANDFLGAERVIVELSKELPKFGVDTTVGVIKYESEPFPPICRELDNHDIKNVIFNSRKKFDFKTVREIDHYIKYHETEVVHGHGYKEDIYAKFLKTPKFKFATNHLWKNSDFKYRCYSYIDALYMRRFNAVIGVSDEIVAQMLKYKIKRTYKISNGIDVDIYDIPPANDLKNELGLSGCLVLGMVSSLTPEKNHETAIKALSEISRKRKDVKLVIVGTGFYRQTLEKRIREFGVDDHIKLLGARDDIARLLSIMDIFLIPSHIEGCPMALIEAMAAGKAVIGSSVGEIPYMLDYGDSGLLVDPKDTKLLIQYISTLTNDDGLMENIGAKAKTRSKKMFSSYSMARKYAILYDEICMSGIV